MIRMIKGTYGLVKSGTVEPMTKHSPAFSINATREAELVEAGVAASTVRSKKEVIALIEAAKAKADSSAEIEAEPSEA